MQPASPSARRVRSASVVFALAVSSLWLGGCFTMSAPDATRGTTSVRVIGDPGAQVSGWYVQAGKRVVLQPHAVPWTLSAANIERLSLTNETPRQSMQVELAYVAPPNAKPPKVTLPDVRTELGFPLYGTANVRVENGFIVTGQ